jgi:hypothetical protein
MWRWANRCWGMTMCCGSKRAWGVGLGLLAVEAGSPPGVDIAEKAAQNKFRRNDTMGGELPRVWNIVQVKKSSFLNFSGTTGLKMPVETSPTKHWVPACRNTILRDEQLSKCCVSAQQFAQQPWLWSQLDLQRHFQMAPRGAISNKIFQTGQIHICMLNSEIKAKWRCCRGIMGAETWDNAVTTGLWSVHNWKAWPTQKWRKCLIAVCAVKPGVTRLRVSQFSGEKPSGCQWSSDFWCLTPPIWVLEQRQEKFQLVGQDVGGVPPRLGGVLHFGSLLCRDGPL